MEIKIGGKNFEVKPLNLKSLKKLAEHGYIEKLSTLNDNMFQKDQLEAVIQTITVTLQRNYPDVTAEWIEENVEVNDIGNVLNAILEASGFKSSDQKKAENL